MMNLLCIYKIPTYITKKKNNHRAHDEYLYQRWTNPTAHKTRKPRRPTANTSAPTTKDDTSVTPTLQTLCTQDTRSSNQTDADILISITIWNKPIVQYRMPIRPSASDRNQSRPPSTAVQYALIGVYDRQLLHPRKSPCLVYHRKKNSGLPC